jgi:hypothetical protein
MRGTILIAGFLVCFASHLFAQGGRISLYGDPSGTECGIISDAGEVVTVYVFHVNALGVTGSQFSAPMPPCAQWTYLSDQFAYDVTFGDSQNGVAVGYGGCRSGTFLIMQVHYYAHGQTDPCCSYPVLPDPREPAAILCADCQFEIEPIYGGGAVINPNSSCDCTIPVDDSNWGRIKSLYR